jgi:DUF4097 and DUF4098 domain-containing protein YvlB
MRTMNTKISVLLITLSAAVLPAMMNAQNRRDRSMSVNVDRERPVTDCKDIQVTYNRRPAITDESQLTLQASQVSSLRAQTSNSGMYVSGWDRNEFSVKTCKAVPDDDPNASATLKEITTSTTNGTISVNGPSERTWVANLIIMVPRLSTMQLQTTNGPLQLRDLAGNIQLRASNGPISLDNVGGVVETTTTNGPISLKNATGDHRLTATNGPIHIGLSGNSWDGPGLEASTQNGPMSVSIPDSYGSAVRIQSSGRAPISCKARACQSAAVSPSSPTTFAIGSGVPLVRLSTVNGPLSIQNGKD